MKRSLLLIFFLGATFAFAKAQNIFTTHQRTYYSSSNEVIEREINTFTIDETAKTFLHSQGSNELTYTIISRKLVNGLWKYELANAEGVVMYVTAAPDFKTFIFYSPNNTEHISSIYDN